MRRRSSSSTRSTRSAARAGRWRSAARASRSRRCNQILTEMDGFSSREGIIVLAATNQPDVLDKALLRPGRFDRRVVVNLPDKTGREAILKVHTRKVPLAGDVEPGRACRDDAGLLGRRPEEPGQRGGAAGGAPRAERGPSEGLPGRAGEDRARPRAPAAPEPRGQASASPITRADTPSSAWWCPAPTRCTGSRSCRAGRRSA